MHCFSLFALARHFLVCEDHAQSLCGTVHAVIATMNRFASALFLIFFVVACAEDGESAPDMGIDAAFLPDLGPTTPLVGEITCGSITCLEGQVCSQEFGGIDLGVPMQPDLSCRPVPAECELRDCQDCRDQYSAACAFALCRQGLINFVTGRRVSCFGQ